MVAQRRAAVASKATGRLIELNVREGSVVKQGELIARLDASDVRAAIVAAEAGVRQAEAGVRQAEVELANAEAELTRSQGLQAQGFGAQGRVLAQRLLDPGLRVLWLGRQRRQLGLQRLQFARRAQRSGGQLCAGGQLQQSHAQRLAAAHSARSWRPAKARTSKPADET